MGEDLGSNNGGDAMGMEEDGVSPEPPDGVANMSIDIDNARALPPELPPAQGLRRNPPVTIEDWPDPDDDFAALDDGDNGAPIDNADQDPEYVERDAPLAFDPNDKPVLDNEEIWVFLEDHLGDLTDEEWIDMYERDLSNKEHTSLQFLASQLCTHFSRQTYNNLHHGPCKPLNLPSEFVAWWCLHILSGLETRAYDCCVNSCCCFLGKYEALDSCPFCKEPRYNSAHKARRAFCYTPLIPQLHALFQNADSVKEMRYRAKAEAAYEPNKLQDVFDGEHYCTLRNTKVNENSNYQFFDNPEDIAFGLSTDGFTLFKQWRRGLSTAWPIILVNYNFHPRIQTQLKNVICVVPLLDEFLILVDGVESSRVAVDEDEDDSDGEEAVRNGDDHHGFYFLLHTFIIMLFGDIPAVAKLLAMKGHNAVLPCRACYMRGCGINGRSIFAHLKSVDLASSAPYDIMHLLFENLVPNMIRHWTGNFKGLNQGTGNYELLGQHWVEIGQLTAKATRTIPAAFVSTLPNIKQDGNLFKAEAYSFWFQYVAPIVLKGRLPERYYQHFLLMREIFLWCLEFKIMSNKIDELQEMVNKWVEDYEKRTGPLWASWAFVMERFCGHLLPAVKNCVQPYEMLNNYVQRRAQMQVVSLYGRFRAQELRDWVDLDTLYNLLPDANAAHQNLLDVPVRVTHYGQVQDIYYVEFIEDPQNNTRRPYLLVCIKECNTSGLDAALPDSPIVTYNRLATLDIIHIDTVIAIVGRIQLAHNKWAIVDWSRNGARTQFVDEEGNEFN
ncbi:hypothetical protein FRC10_000530 [Ceratobasidium sp. 414]|nr:hypothetical protein FRC10_000530 [Ceratobasidium sp. 414]